MTVQISLCEPWGQGRKSGKTSGLNRSCTQKLLYKLIQDKFIIWSILWPHPTHKSKRCTIEFCFPGTIPLFLNRIAAVGNITAPLWGHIYCHFRLLQSNDSLHWEKTESRGKHIAHLSCGRPRVTHRDLGNHSRVSQAGGFSFSHILHLRVVFWVSN